MSLSNTIVLLLAICACALGTAPPTLLPHHHHHPSPSSTPLPLNESHQFETPPPNDPIHAADKMVMDQPKEDMDPHKDHDQPKDHDQHKDHDDMDMDMDMGNMTHMMKMYFHFGVDEYVLFKEWKIKTVGGMLASVFGIFLMGMLYEGLKYFREYLFKQYVSNIQFSTVAITGESGKVTQVHKVERHRMMSFPHAIQTGLHMVQIIVSYFLMLIFMTYNVWLCLSVVLGAGVGYFVFGWKKASVVDITEHCH